MKEISELKSYMDWYGARRENAHNVLMNVAEQLKARGCKVYSSRWRSARQDGWRDYIIVQKGDLRTYVGFREVPYGWYVDSEGSSSNYRGLVGEYGFGFPYTIDEILESMRPCNKKIYSFHVEI